MIRYLDGFDYGRKDPDNFSSIQKQLKILGDKFVVSYSTDDTSNHIERARL